jgi:hypothetical protein
MVFKIFKKKEEERDISTEKTREIPAIAAPPPPLEFSNLPNLKPVEEERIAPPLIIPPKLVPVGEDSVKESKLTDEIKPIPQLKEKAVAPPPPVTTKKEDVLPKSSSQSTQRIPPEKKIIKDKALPTVTGPLFVKVSDYKAILDCTNVIKSSIKEAENIILRLNELKNEQDKAFEVWRNQLEDVQRKLTYIDKSVFEAG